MNRLRHSAAGFSLLEVLVTVALVGVSLTVLSGIQRTQMRSLAKLRAHAEARLLLGQAVERWQYGDVLSTLATSAVYSEHAPDRVWSVSFDEQGHVVQRHEPDWSYQPDPSVVPSSIPSRSILIMSRLACPSK